ncbi:hypothetical protein M9D40_004435 [Pasteurella multocida]|nr:hypothetical protein [Pasteurella multocida]WEO86799.1 hypothetical protein M9D40_004435 [Pasteurella multocida]
MSLFKRATELFKSGNYKDALTLYENIAKIYGSESLVKYNIDICKKNITQSKSNKIEEDNISGENKFSVSIKDLYNEISNSELGITKERLGAPL